MRAVSGHCGGSGYLVKGQCEGSGYLVRGQCMVSVRAVGT